MFGLSARRTLALYPNYVCPRCSLTRLVSQGCRNFQTRKALHLDSQSVAEDPFPATTLATTPNSNHVSRRLSYRPLKAVLSKSIREPRKRKRSASRNDTRSALQKTTHTPIWVRLLQLRRARQAALQALRQRQELSSRAQNELDGTNVKALHENGAHAKNPDSYKEASSQPATSKQAGKQTGKQTSPSSTVASKYKKLLWSLLPHAKKLRMQPVHLAQEKPPRLSYGLDRVLFNPGVYRLQDPRSRVYNFDPYLEEIMPVEEFDYDALRRYVTSSKDDTLTSIAGEQQKKYTGSTSSMTNVLSHLHYLLSSWRTPNMNMLSAAFPAEHKSFTSLSRAPAAGIMVWKQNGIYSMDADKEFSTSSVLSMLGRSMEKLLTLNMDEYEQYRKTQSKDGSQLPKEIESYHYSTIGDFIFRSQLDAYDPRLPGAGIFDVKTRAVVSVRMDSQNPHKGSGYEIVTNLGEWESFEREYYDMIRAAFLKYSLQVRMGRMDGIFVAYHNTKRIFGFQYIPTSEMDFALHGQTDPTLGDQEFLYSMTLLNRLLDRATERFPKQSLRLHVETRGTPTAPFMYFIAEPVSEAQIDVIQNQSREDENFVETHNGEDATVTKDESVSDIEGQDMNQIIMSLAETRSSLSDNWATVIEEDSSGVADAPIYEHDSDALSDHSPSSSHELPETATLAMRVEQQCQPWDLLQDEEAIEDDLTVDLAEHIHAHDYGVLETLEGAIDASMRGSDEAHNIDRTEEMEEENTHRQEDLDRDEGSRPSSGLESEISVSSGSSNDTNLLVLKIRVMHKSGDSRSLSPPTTLTADSPPWRTMFNIEEIKADPATVIYEACKTRRKNTLERTKAFTGAYLSKLWELSSKGKQRRSTLNAKDATLEKVIFSPGSDAHGRSS